METPAPTPDPAASTVSTSQILAAVRATWRLPRDAALAELAHWDAVLRGWPDALLDDDGARALALVAHHVFLFDGQRPMWQAALDRAEAWTRTHDVPDRLCQVCLVRGVTHAGLMELGESVRWLTRAAEVARAAGLTFRLTTIWEALGTRLSESGLVRDARYCYRMGLELSLQLEGAEHRALQVSAALGNLATLDMLAGRHAQALQQADAWFEHWRVAAPLEPPARTFSSLHDVRASALMGLGRVAEAETEAALALDWARRSTDLKAIAFAELLGGEVRIAAGQTEVGLEVVRRTVERARRDLPQLLNAVLRRAVAAYERAGQADVARMYLHELVEIGRGVRLRAGDRLRADVQALRASFADEEASEPGDEHEEHASALAAGAAPMNHERLQRLNRLVEEHAIAAERLDDTTGKHCYRVGRMASLLGRAVGLDEDVCFMLDLAARLHDVGKLAVPESVLMKPGRLTEAEREVMQGHTVAGWEILSQSNIPQMGIAQEIARHHHEWWNGGGYPDGLAGLRIPIAARVSALADVFDALTHARPYKQAWTIDAALAEIVRLRGVQFDPAITDVFVRLVSELRATHGDDLDKLLGEAAQDSPFVQERQRIEVALADVVARGRPAAARAPAAVRAGPA